MLAFSRFRVPAGRQDEFRTRAAEVAAFFAGRPGNVAASVVRSLDEPQLWAIVTQWKDVGSYRRSFNGYEAKMLLTPLLGEAIDEPSAWADPELVGENIPRQA